MDQQRDGVRAVFDRALEIESPTERRSFLEEACAGNPGLRQEVESLLRAHGQAGDFLDRPAVEQAIVAPPPAPDATVTLDPNAKEGESAARPDRPGPTNAQADSEADDQETALDFLQPSTKPGSLGRLAHYEVLEVLGKGGFGIVLKAFDEKLHRVVAVKVMAPHLAATSPARKRFLREARASAAIRHENVVAIYAVEDQPIPYLVMEYIAGQTLQERLDSHGPLDLKEILAIGRQVAAGLAAAHAMGIIHRDVKPANILLESGVDHVKITDFGLARAADDASVTQSGVVAGTPMYMAPEQAMGEALDFRADLFSLGSVLYVMCTGRPPFRASTMMAVLKRVAEDTPRSMREVIPEVPEWLCALVARLHAKKPEDRYASAKEVAEVLASCLSEMQLRGHISLASQGPAPAQRIEAPRGRVAPSPAAPGARRGGRRWMAVAAAFLLLLAGLGATEVTGVTHLADAALRLFQPNRVVPPVPDESPPLAVAPFDAKQAREYQEAWAKHLHVPLEVENSIGMKLRLMPPGEFFMGSSQEEVDAVLKEVWQSHQDRVHSETPQRHMRIEAPFFLGQYEVTVGQFRQFVDATGYRTWAEASGQGGTHWDDENKAMVSDPHDIWSKPRLARTNDCAVGFLKRSDAQAFCDWLGANEGMRYVLPEEEQWEFACRAGTTGRWYNGDDPVQVQRLGWFLPDDGATHPGGSKEPNAFGLFDMLGNANEWVGNPQSPTVLRGGDAGNSIWTCRSASRSHETDETPPWRLWGFRVAVVGDLSKFKPNRPTTESHDVRSASPPLAVAPFDAKQAHAHQEGWAKHLHVPVEVENSIGMKLRLVPPGQFLMGSTQEQADTALKAMGKDFESNIRSETPQHSETIEEPFFLGAYQVTVGQFRQFVKATGYHTLAEADGKGGLNFDEKGAIINDPKMVWNKGVFAASDEHPACVLMRPDAQAFCDWLGAKEGVRYVLPDEEQWEYACRAGTTGQWCSGDDPEQAKRFGWSMSDSGGMTHPVGSKRPNAFGLYDMHGNVKEWVGNPQSPLMLRGGDVGCPSAWHGRSAMRSWDFETREFPWPWWGFRVAVVGDLSKFKRP